MWEMRWGWPFMSRIRQDLPLRQSHTCEAFHYCTNSHCRSEAAQGSKGPEPFFKTLPNFSAVTIDNLGFPFMPSDCPAMCLGDTGAAVPSLPTNTRYRFCNNFLLFLGPCRLPLVSGKQCFRSITPCILCSPDSHCGASQHIPRMCCEFVQRGGSEADTRP
jgi:hypothetical protein